MPPACEHFRRFKDEDAETYISQSEGHPWNAWVEVYDSRGKLIYSSFETGLFYDFLLHLKDNPSCRKQVGMRKRTLQRLLKEVEEEWEYMTKDC